MDYYLKLSPMPSKSSARRPPEEVLDIWVDCPYWTINVRDLRKILQNRNHFQVIRILPYHRGRIATLRIRLQNRRSSPTWNQLIPKIILSLQKYLGRMTEVPLVPQR